MSKLVITNNVVDLRELILTDDDIYSRGDLYVGFDLICNQWVIERPAVGVIRHSTPLKRPKSKYSKSFLLNLLREAGIPESYLVCIR